jgi:hypothetical protein
MEIYTSPTGKTKTVSAGGKITPHLHGKHIAFKYVNTSSVGKTAFHL